MTTLTASELKRPSFVNGVKRLLIDGRWQEAAAGGQINVVNPATGETVATLADGGQADVDLAVKAARRVFEGEWSRWTPYDRQRLLLRVHDLIEKNFDELAAIETLDMGMPLTRTMMLKRWASQTVLFYSSQTSAASSETSNNSIPGRIMTLSLKAPVGVVGGIIPWNSPLVSVWWIVGPVLATGCTAVLKPAEDASLSVLRIAELLQEAGLPDGVVNVVTGYGHTAGAALAGHADVDRVAFTGSVETGRKIVTASTSNLKRIQLELGGKSPDIVFADAKLDAAVPGAAMSVFGNSGQVCVAGTRLFVQRSIQEEFVDRLKAFSKNLKVGNGLDPEVQIGPVVSRKQMERILGYITIGNEEGARLACGGRQLSGDLSTGFFVEPTVFADVHNDMRIAREEIFGPVISVIPFNDEADALRLANDTEFGLAGGVWTESASTALRMAQGIKAGTIWVNCYGPLDPGVGFGGYKMSGYGWKGGRDHVEGFLYKKVVYMNIG